MKGNTTHDVPLPGRPWSLHGAPPAIDGASIAAVREHLVEAYRPRLPGPQHRRLLRDIALPEAVLVRLDRQTHRTDAVDELDRPSSKEFLQRIIPASADALRQGRADITGGLARIWCAPAEDHDDEAAGAARLQSVHLAKVRQDWKITAIVAQIPRAT